MVKYGFSNGIFGQKDVKIEDVASTLPALPPVDKFSQLESTQKLLQKENLKLKRLLREQSLFSKK